MSSGSQGGFGHVPVMVEEVVAAFDPVPAGLVVDATVGGGSHARALLERRHDLRVIGLDRDPDAVDAASAELAPFGDRAVVHRARFDEMEAVLAEHGIGRFPRGHRPPGSVGPDSGPEGSEGVAGVLFDLGVSSPQLDRAERGFSYHHSGPIDMRMDPHQPFSALDVVNTYSEERLAEVLRRFGDERHARRIARAVVAARPLATTDDLAQVISSAIPAPGRRRGGHPARRSFQALRIEVNEELAVLGPSIDAALDFLAPGGRCAVLSYHSGEDRIVKDRFTRAVTGGCTCPPALGCVCGAVARARWVFRGSRQPSEAEIQRNRRAQSARLRVVEAVA